MCVPCEYCGCLDSYSGALCEAGSVQRERETEIVQLTTLSHSYRAHTNIHTTTNIHCYTQKNYVFIISYSKSKEYKKIAAP